MDWFKNKKERKKNYCDWYGRKSEDTYNESSHRNYEQSEDEVNKFFPLFLFVKINFFYNFIKCANPPTRVLSEIHIPNKERKEKKIWLKRELTASFSNWLNFSLCRKFFFARSTFCSNFRWRLLHVLIFESFLLCSFKWCDLLWSISTCDDDDVVLISDGFRNVTSISSNCPTIWWWISSSFDVELSLPKFLLFKRFCCKQQIFFDIWQIEKYFFLFFSP